MKRFGLAMAAMVLGSAAWAMPGGHGTKDHAAKDHSSGGCGMHGAQADASHDGHGPMHHAGKGHRMIGHGMGHGMGHPMGQHRTPDAEAPAPKRAPQ